MGWHDDIPALRIGVWDRWGLNGSTWKERGASEHTAVHARPKRRFMRVPHGGSCASRTAVHARPVCGAGVPAGPSRRRRARRVGGWGQGEAGSWWSAVSLSSEESVAQAVSAVSDAAAGRDELGSEGSASTAATGIGSAPVRDACAAAMTASAARARAAIGRRVWWGGAAHCLGQRSRVRGLCAGRRAWRAPRSGGSPRHSPVRRPRGGRRGWRCRGCSRPPCHRHTGSR